MLDVVESVNQDLIVESWVVSNRDGQMIAKLLLASQDCGVEADIAGLRLLTFLQLNHPAQLTAVFLLLDVQVLLERRVRLAEDVSKAAVVTLSQICSAVTSHVEFCTKYTRLYLRARIRNLMRVRRLQR